MNEIIWTRSSVRSCQLLCIYQGLTEPVLVTGVRVVNEEEEEEEEEEEVCTYEVRLTVNEIIWTRSSVRSCQLLCISARV